MFTNEISKLGLAYGQKPNIYKLHKTENVRVYECMY